MLNQNEVRYFNELINCYPFPVGLWIDLQRHLVAADVIMRNIAKKYKMKFNSNTPYFDGGRWPGRVLKKRKWFKVYQIQVMLNKDYLNDKRIFYELSETCIILVFLWGKTLWHKKINEYSVEQMNNQESILGDILGLVNDIKK